MNLTQFKAFYTGAKVTSSKFPPERLDEIFTTVATMPQALERKTDAMASSTMNLVDFVIAIVHVAYHRYAVVVRPHHGFAAEYIYSHICGNIGCVTLRIDVFLGLSKVAYRRGGLIGDEPRALCDCTCSRRVPLLCRCGAAPPALPKKKILYIQLYITAIS
jgi:hypothetical protein